MKVLAVQFAAENPYKEGADYDVRTSYSQSLQIRQCPLQWHYAHKLKQPAFPGWPAERGKFAHAVCEAYARYCLDHQVPHAPEQATAIWRSVLAQHPVPQDIQDVVATIFAEFVGSHEFVVNPGEKHMVEARFFLVVEDDDGFRVCVEGKIDYAIVDEQRRLASVTDYKTAARVMSTRRSGGDDDDSEDDDAEDSDFDREVQLPTYLAPLWYQHSLKGGEGYLDYIATGAGPLRKVIGQAEIDAALRYHVDSARMIRAARALKDEPDARPGRPCAPFAGGVCGYVLKCPAARSLGIPDVLTEAGALDLLGRYHAAHTFAGVAKAMVKAYVVEGGCVLRAGGAKAEVAESETLTINTVEEVRYVVGNIPEADWPKRLSVLKTPKSRKQEMVDRGTATRGTTLKFRIVKDKETK